jgi:hypothetical protein
MATEPNIDHLADVSVCGCGSCKQAIEDALTEFQTMTRDKCLHWWFTRVTIQAAMAQMLIGASALDAAQRIQDRQNRLVDSMEAGVLDYLLERIAAIDEVNTKLHSGSGKLDS